MPHEVDATAKSLGANVPTAWTFNEIMYAECLTQGLAQEVVVKVNLQL